MNPPTPKATGLQIALILSFMLALILGVTVYMLYKENQELKQELEQWKTPSTVSLQPLSHSLPLSCQQCDADSFQLPFGLSLPAI